MYGCPGYILNFSFLALGSQTREPVQGSMRLPFVSAVPTFSKFCLYEIRFSAISPLCNLQNSGCIFLPHLIKSLYACVHVCARALSGASECVCVRAHALTHMYAYTCMYACMYIIRGVCFCFFICWYFIEFSKCVSRSHFLVFCIFIKNYRPVYWH